MLHSCLLDGEADHPERLEWESTNQVSFNRLMLVSCILLKSHPCSFTNKDDQFVSPLVFGPFPPGIGQSFVLPISNHFNPQEYLPDETLQRILSAYEKTSSPTSPSPTSPLPQSPISPSAPLLPNGSSRANTNAGPSVSVDVESVPISPVYGADIAESIPSRIFFPLTIVLQADSGTISEANPSNAPLSSQTVNSQISFATIHLGQHSSVESKILKQVLFVTLSLLHCGIFTLVFIYLL